MLLPLTLLASATPVCVSPQGEAVPRDARPERAAGPLPEVQRSVPPPQGTPSTVQRVHSPSTPITRPDGNAHTSFDASALRLNASFDRHSVVHQDFVNGVHWARGRTYKASASPTGFTYIPFFGPEAPRTWPVEFRLASVERDGVAVELDEEAAVRREGSRWILDRGDVEVWYDLDVDEVEQSFAFSAPSGAGDITLRLDVSTDLAAEAVPDSAANGSFQFAGSLGHVAYGEAIVLDGEGRRADVRSRWVDGSIELTVPAAFVAAAVGPIVVDPILSTSVIDGFSENLLFPDVAYDRELDRYLVVYEENFAATDFDVYSQFVNALTLVSSDGAYIDITADTWSQPKVAQNRFSRRFLVVAEADSAAVPGSTDVAGRFRLADGSLETPLILRSATTFYGCEAPDVGGEAIDSASSYFCLAFNRNYGTDRDVFAVVLDQSGNEFNPEVQLAGFVSRDEGAPAVSENSGLAALASRWNVAWATDDLNNPQSKVEGAQISFTGSTVFGPFDIAPFANILGYFDVEVSSMCGRRQDGTNELYWVATYDDLDSIETDAFVALCAGAEVASTTELQEIEHHPKSANDDDVVIGTLENYFLFAYVSGEDLVATIAQPFEDRLGMTERRVPGAATPTRQTLSIATTLSAGGIFNDGMLVWSHFNGVDYDIEGARIAAEPSFVASGTQYCYGFPNSTGDHGFMLAFGDRETTSTQTLIASALPLNTFGFFLASTTQGFAPGAGGSAGALCLGGAVGRFGTFNSGSGGRGILALNPQNIAQPTGAVTAMGGETWNFQVWHRDAAGGVATSNFTNAVAIPFL